MGVFGYVNGKEVYSRDEFIFAKRGFGAIENDDELVAFATKCSWNFSCAGHHSTFTEAYLSDYALSEPYASLTKAEFNRLKELQQELRSKAKAEDDAREWHFVEKVFWADNSEEEIWEDKDGNRKTVMVVAPHGDVC